MNLPEDTNYLKRFVKENPENKMGWYLLGRRYLADGKEGKANYCFMQAGDIYRAYEQEDHPIAEFEMQQLKTYEADKKRKKKWKRAAVLGGFLLVAASAMPLYYLFNQLPAAEKETLPASLPFSGEPTELKIGVLLLPVTNTQPAATGVQQVMSAGKEAPEQTLVVNLEKDERWYDWLGNKRLLMSIDRSTASDWNVSIYNKELCSCEPLSADSLKSQLASWSKSQESHWTLASAAQHYEKLNGKWPERLEDMVKPYPNNILSGSNKEMEKSFNWIIEKMKTARLEQNESDLTSTSTDKSAVPKAKSTVGSNGLLQEKWEKPLEIIIDPSKHRLAIVHKDIIIRSYRVGLGGNRTPQGSFYISEKVKDPKGKQKGMFGTRGMALSNTLYAIHGTDKMESIGEDESQGCIRLLNRDVEELYDLVPLGTAVHIRYDSLPENASTPASERFELESKQEETNPEKVYTWLH